MKTQYLLLVLYAGFVATSLGYLMFVSQWQVDRRIVPEVVGELRSAATTLTSMEEARQRSLDAILLLEIRERDHRVAANLNRYYLIFALVATLPLLAYAGQAMRDKLFVNRPVNMPRIVYWTLFGVSTRSTAVRYMWLSVALAFVSAAVALVVPIGFLGLVSLGTAYLYQNAIEWVDTHAYWAHETMDPFPRR